MRWVGALGFIIVVSCSSFTGNDTSSPTAPDAGTEAGDSGTPDAATGDAAVCSSHLDSDPANCGACGHSCFGGACSAGKCQPEQLGSFIAAPVVNVASWQAHVAATKKHIVWSWEAGGAVQIAVCDIAGCNQAPGVTNGPGGITGFAASEDSVFIDSDAGTNSVVIRIDASGTPTTFENAFQHPQGMFAFSDKLYLFDYYDSSDKGVFTYDLTGGPTTWNEVFNLNDNDHSWVQLVVTNDGNVFIAENNGISIGPNTADLGPALFCGPPACSNNVLGMATDGTSIYFADDTSRSVRKKVGTAAMLDPSVSVTGPTSFAEAPLLVAFDPQGRLYVMTKPNDADHLKRLYACEPGVSASDPASCLAVQTAITAERDFYGNVSVTADALYWIADDGVVEAGTDHQFRVMRLAK